MHVILRYLLTELFLSVTAYIIVPLCGVSYVIIKRIYVCMYVLIRFICTIVLFFLTARVNSFSSFFLSSLNFFFVLFLRGLK